MEGKLRIISRVITVLFIGLTVLSIGLWFWNKPLSSTLSLAGTFALLLSILCDSYLPQRHLSAAKNLKMRKGMFAGLGVFTLSLLIQWQAPQIERVFHQIF